MGKGEGETTRTGLPHTIHSNHPTRTDQRRWTNHSKEPNINIKSNKCKVKFGVGNDTRVRSKYKYDFNINYMKSLIGMDMHGYAWISLLNWIIIFWYNYNNLFKFKFIITLISHQYSSSSIISHPQGVN